MLKEVKALSAALVLCAYGPACSGSNLVDDVDQPKTVTQIDPGTSTEELYFELVQLQGLGLLQPGRMEALQRALDEIDVRETNPSEHTRSTRATIEATLRRTYSELGDNQEALQGREGRRYAAQLPPLGPPRG